MGGQATNGCVSHVFLVAALRHVHGQRPCIFAAHVESCISLVSQSLRQLLAKYRGVCADQSRYELLRAKVTRGQTNFLRPSRACAES